MSLLLLVGCNDILTLLSKFNQFLANFKTFSHFSLSYSFLIILLISCYNLGCRVVGQWLGLGLGCRVVGQWLGLGLGCRVVGQWLGLGLGCRVVGQWLGLGWLDSG